MKPLRVKYIKSSFLRRLDRKRKTDNKTHGKFNTSVVAWEDCDDDVSGAPPTEDANEPDIRVHDDNGRVETVTVKDVKSIEDTSMEKRSSGKSSTATSAMSGRMKGLVTPVLRAITMKKRTPKVKQRHTEQLFTETDVEQHSPKESGEIADGALYEVKSRSPTCATQENDKISCAGTEAICDEVDIVSIQDQDETKKSDVQDVGITNDPVKNEIKPEDSKGNEFKASSTPCFGLSLATEETSHLSFSLISENISARETMEYGTSTSKSSCFAAQTMSSPKACYSTDETMSSPIDSEPTKQISIEHSTNETQIESYSAAEDAAFAIDNCETSTATSLSFSNKLLPSLPNTCNSSSVIVHNSSTLSNELEHDASKGILKECRNDEHAISRFPGKNVTQTKFPSIEQEGSSTVTSDEQMICSVLSQAKTDDCKWDTSTVTPSTQKTAPTLEWFDSPSRVNIVLNYKTEDVTDNKDKECNIANRKVDHLFTGTKIPLTRAVSDSLANTSSSHKADAVKAYQLVNPRSWSGHYNDTNISASDEDDGDSSYVTHLSGIDEDGGFDQSRCGLSDEMHNTLIWWGERIYKVFGEPREETKEKFIDIMRSTEEAAYVIRDLSQLKF